MLLQLAIIRHLAVITASIFSSKTNHYVLLTCNAKLLMYFLTHTIQKMFQWLLPGIKPQTHRAIFSLNYYLI